MSHIIIAVFLALFLNGCFYSKSITIPYKEIEIKKSSANGYTSNKETPFFFEYDGYVLGAVFWQDINDIQPNGKLLFSFKDGHQKLLNIKIIPCEKYFYKGVEDKTYFIIKDKLCVEKM